MPTHAQKKVVPYTPRQMFDLVADVEKYPDFLPWVVSSKISDPIESVSADTSGHRFKQFTADVVIGYKMISYPYRCVVHLTPYERIDIEYLEGPFKYLNNHWTFTPINDRLTEIDFYMDFELKTTALQSMLQPVFSDVVGRMIDAFERQAAKEY